MEIDNFLFQMGNRFFYIYIFCWSVLKSKTNKFCFFFFFWSRKEGNIWITMTLNLVSFSAFKIKEQVMIWESYTNTREEIETGWWWIRPFTSCHWNHKFSGFSAFPDFYCTAYLLFVTVSVSVLPDDNPLKYISHLLNIS